MQCTIFKFFPTFKLYLSLNEHFLNLLKCSLKSSHNLSVIDSSQTWHWSPSKYYKRYTLKINNKALFYLSDLSPLFYCVLSDVFYTYTCMYISVHMCLSQISNTMYRLFCTSFPFNSIFFYTFNTISQSLFSPDRCFT